MRILLCCSLLVMFVACTHPVQQVPIDRKALVSRNNPQFSAFDSLASLSVGNGEFVRGEKRCVSKFGRSENI